MSGADEGRGIEPAGFRLPSGTTPGTVALQVADLGRSGRWYREVLGLEAREGEGGELLLSARGGTTPLLRLVERAGAVPAPRGRRWGLYHFALLLPERGALARFLRHLSDSGVRAGASDHRVSEALYLTDPDGLGVEVYADRPRASWEYHEGELVMATDPLAVQELLGIAGEGRWTGPPAGTRVGHLHLHVGELDEASAFYHDGLGLDRVVWSYPGALFLSAGGYHHHLGVNTWARGASPPEDREARLLEWSLVIPGVGAAASAVESLAAAGWNAREVPSGEGGGWRVPDPWGTLLRLLPG